MSAIKKAILSAVGRRFLSAARISKVTAPADNFRFIELKSEDFKKSAWRAGDKVQINTGAWNMRTYTPISLDLSDGAITILAFVRGGSPGSTWAGSAKSGGECEVLGPRPSMGLSGIIEPILLFGDETCFGLAAAAQVRHRNVGADRFIFEVNSGQESRSVLERLSLGTATVLPKKSDQSHIEAATRLISEFSGDLRNCRVILAGRAKSIQALRAGLKDLIRSGRVITKVYWADGKTGID